MRLHRWSGLIASVNLAVLVVTGVLMLFEHEIESLAGSSDAPSPEPTVSLAGAIDLARAAVPGDAVAIARAFGDYPGIVFVSVETPTGRRSVAVDTVRGMVTDAPSHDTSFFGTIWRLHAELLAGTTGTTIAGAIAALMLVSLVTGLCIYGPLMRGFTLALLRQKRPLRAVIADAHKLVGIGVLAWGLVVASTGVILAWGVPSARAHGVHALGAAGPVRHDVSDIDRAVRSAEATRERARWWTVLLPREDGRYGVVMRGGSGLGKRVVTMARVDGDAVTAEPIAELAFTLGPIHFAEFGGLTIKVVWAIFATGLLGLTVSGLFMRVARI